MCDFCKDIKRISYGEEIECTEIGFAREKIILCKSSRTHPPQHFQCRWGMNAFLKFFDDKAKDFPMHLKITYSKICDWNILIYKRGCADDYPKARYDGEDVIIVNESDCDIELCFAKAHVELKEWLLKFNGGY